jgi:hypothetical protein
MSHRIPAVATMRSDDLFQIPGPAGPKHPRGDQEASRGRGAQLIREGQSPM